MYVSIDGADVLAGRLFAHARHGTESATFTYDAGYLADPRGYALEPALPLTDGPHQTEPGLAMFRSFADTAPNRWGRRLLARAERLRAERTGTTTRTLTELTYLLGARDDLRHGALRFRDVTTGTWLAAGQDAVPAVAALPDLLALATRAERDDASWDDLSRLVRAGSSLGGARPKVHLVAPDGRVAIAKFPNSDSDTWNVMAWEKTVTDLARLAGVTVPPTELVTVAGRQVHVVDRFDRSGAARIGYISALTMLEARDGDIGTYVELASAIERFSARATEDLRELWRRVALSILVSNTDDHLRNHGFLHAHGDAWVLAPAFDLNPNPAAGPRHLATAIADPDDTRASVEALMRVAPLFRLAQDAALQALRKVCDATGQWRAVASRHGLTEHEIDAMAPAFEHAEREVARGAVGE